MRLLVACCQQKEAATFQLGWSSAAGAFSQYLQAPLEREGLRKERCKPSLLLGGSWTGC